VARGAKPAGTAGEHQAVFRVAVGTADAGEPAARVAAVEVSFNDFLDDRPQEAVALLKTSLILQVNAFGLTLKQKLFIKFLTRQLSWDETHLNNFIRKYYQREGLDTLTRKEASKLIESLKAIRKHELQTE
jgi:hypothetical protein